MPQLSVVVITFNEEVNIGRCLDSVKGIADDIVVVDSFSTDKTEEICRQKGARFIQHAFHGHIEQKNFAVTQAKFTHILSLDADEMLSDELRRSIENVKQHWTHDGYYMNRLTNYCGKWVRHCGWYPDRKLRLWNSLHGTWKGTNPHDKYEMHKGDQVTKLLKGDLLHYSYYSLADHYKQMNYFTDIASKAMMAKGKRTSIVKLYISPVVRFIRDYILKLGILDGRTGFTICRVSAYATFLKYKKLRTLQSRRA